MRDPKTGRMLSHFETLARQNELAAQQLGQNSDDKLLTAVQVQAQHDSPAVQTYVQHMLEFVRSEGGNVRGLRNAVGEIQKFVDEVLKSDTTLTLAEQKRIQHYAQQVIEALRLKTSLLNRVGNRVRQTGNAIREKTHDVLKEVAHGEGGYSFTFDMLSRAFKPRDDKKQKAALEQRAEAYHGLAQRNSTPHSAATHAAATIEPSQQSTSPTRVSKGPASSAPTVNVPAMNQLLQTNTSLLSEVKSIRIIMQKQFDASLLLKDEHEREANDASPLRVPGAEGPAEEKHKTGSAIGNLFSRFFGGLSSVWKMAVGGLMAGLASHLGDLVKLTRAGLSGVFDIFKGAPKLPTPSVPGSPSPIPGVPKGVGAFGVGPWAGLATEIGTGTGVAAIAAAAAVGGVIGQKVLAPAAKDNSNAIKRLYNRASDAFMFGGAYWTDKLGITQGALDRSEENAAAHNQTIAAPTPNPVPVIAPNAPTTPTKSMVPPVVRPSTTTPERVVGATHASNKAIDFIKQQERFAKKAYPDGKNRKTGEQDYAIGYGSHMWNGRPVKDLYKENPNFTVTEADAAANLRTRVEREFAPEVRRQLTRPVSQDEFDSLVSMAYNRGTGAFRGDRAFLDKVNAGTVTAADFQTTFTTPDKAARRALTHRRGDEFAMYSGAMSPNRDAQPVAQGTVAAGGANITVVAPSTTIVPQRGGTPRHRLSISLSRCKRTIWRRRCERCAGRTRF
jgi:GH24 family phage-related lysozyme (muramidase)